MPGSEFETKSAATTGLEVKFQSAVNLIRSLPKDGPFQPSYEDASKVYGYYKQATLGPCKQSKPGFWDVVGRAKWNAWSELGDMSKDRAMENYITEIKRLFENLTKSEEFEEQQNELSDAIVPFCMENGIKLPATLGKVIAAKKLRYKADEILTEPKINGYVNGNHEYSQSPISDVLEVRINGKDVKVMPNGDKEEPIKRDGQLNGPSTDEMPFASDKTSGSVNERSKTYDDEIVNYKFENISASRSLNGDELKKEGISTSSDDDDDNDVYCDSFNPDNVPSFVSTNGSTSNTSEVQMTVYVTENDLTQVSQVISVLGSEMSSAIGEDFQIHSTPAVKTQQLQNMSENDLGGSHNNENVTDISTLSSSSMGHDTVQVESTVTKHSNRVIEDELCREFSMKDKKQTQKRKSHKSRVQHHTSDRIGSIGVQAQEYGYEEHQLVVSARGGSSQTDLAASGGNSHSQSKTNAPRQAEVRSSASHGKKPSTRPRRSPDESSSDSSGSSYSSGATTETIGVQIVRTLERLEKDMQMVLLRLNSIEDGIRSAHTVERQPWWTGYIPSKRVMMLLLWPIIINIVFAYWRRRRRK